MKKNNKIKAEEKKIRNRKTFITLAWQNVIEIVLVANWQHENWEAKVLPCFLHAAQEIRNNIQRLREFQGWCFEFFFSYLLFCNPKTQCRWTTWTCCRSFHIRAQYVDIFKAVSTTKCDDMHRATHNLGVAWGVNRIKACTTVPCVHSCCGF